MKQSPLHAAVIEVLRQGESLLRQIDQDKYTRRLRPVFNSAIGGHYRHCLDHFRSLLRGLDLGEINYDLRERNLLIEEDRNFALSETQLIILASESIAPSFLACPINVRSQVAYDCGDAPVIQSTVGRELMDAVAHAIHHYALIAVMCELLGVVVPSGFGVAPSTLRYHAEQKKAA